MGNLKLELFGIFNSAKSPKDLDKLKEIISGVIGIEIYDINNQSKMSTKTNVISSSTIEENGQVVVNRVIHETTFLKKEIGLAFDKTSRYRAFDFSDEELRKILYEYENKQ